MAFFPRKPRPPLPRGAVAFFGILCAALGLFFICYAAVPLAERAWTVDHWDEVPCHVKKAELAVTVDKEGTPVFKPVVEYEYTRQGQTLTSSRYAVPYRGPGAEPNREANEWEEALAAFRTKTAQTCRVNPADPNDAVLEKPGYGDVLVFAAVGAMCLVAAVLLGWCALRRNTSSRTRQSRWVLVVPAFFLIFTASGALCFWLALRDNWKAVEPRMQEVPCTIVAARVKSASSSTRMGGTHTTFSPDILFRYDWEGQVWHSGWLDFSRNNVHSSDASSAQETINRYPPASVQKCWLDPERPWVAVLEKNAGPAWVLSLCGSVFCGIGLLGLGSWFGRRFLFRRFKKPAPAL